MSWCFVAAAVVGLHPSRSFDVGIATEGRLGMSILAEGAIALPVTLSGGALFAS